MKKIILVILTIFIYSNIQAQEWKLIFEDDNHKTYSREHTKNSSWYKLEFKEEKEYDDGINGFKYNKVLWLLKFDCTEKVYGFLAEHYYDKEDNIVLSKDNGTVTTMKNMIPDSGFEFLFLKFCNSKN